MREVNKKVLVVDDNHDTLYLICELLREHHFECLTADTPQEGLSIALEARPNLIILDMILPGMSGFGFMRELSRHKELENVPVIVLTVVNDEEVEDAMSDMGAVAYLRKVCLDQELVATVAAHVG